MKPLHDDYYWEMYATPSGNKSTLFFPRDRAGMEADHFLRDHTFRGLEVSAGMVDGGGGARLALEPAGTVLVSREAGGDIVLCNVSESISNILRVLDLVDFLTIESDTENALKTCSL